MLDYLIFELSRPKKRLFSLIIDTILIVSSFFFAYWTRLGEITSFDNRQIWFALVCTLIVTLITFVKLGLYRAVLRYISFKALAMIAIGALISAISLVLFSFFIDSFIPRTVPFIYFSYVKLFLSRLITFIAFTKYYYLFNILDKNSFVLSCLGLSKIISGLSSSTITP